MRDRTRGHAHMPLREFGTAAWSRWYTPHSFALAMRRQFSCAPDQAQLSYNAALYRRIFRKPQEASSPSLSFVSSSGLA